MKKISEQEIKNDRLISKLVQSYFGYIVKIKSLIIVIGS
jgi:hypothetical protein